MPTYNPLIGWVGDDGDLIGFAGQERAGGMPGGQDNGYNGQVNNAKDFGKSLLGGAGTVFGGLPGAAVMMGNLIAGNAPTAGTMALGRTILQSAGLIDPSPSVIGPVMNDLTAGEFGGKMGEAASSAGSFDSEHDFSAGDRGAEGDATAEARGFSMGGFTGGVEGAPAGVVHGQELVLSAPAVRALGPVAGQLAGLNELARPRNGMGPNSWSELVMMRHPEAWR